MQLCTGETADFPPQGLRKSGYGEADLVEHYIRTIAKNVNYIERTTSDPR